MRVTTQYRLAGDLPTLGKTRTVLWMGMGIPCRFDYRSDAWVEDREMARIFVGKTLTLPVTEQQAKGTIERNGGRWVVPELPPTMTPAQERDIGLRDQMVANWNSVPTPPGIENLPEDMGTVVPFWAVVGEPQTVLWSGGNQMRVWRFDYSTNSWVIDPNTHSDFIGTPETMPISEAEAREMIERDGGTWVIPPGRSGTSRTGPC